MGVLKFQRLDHGAQRAHGSFRGLLFVCARTGFTFPRQGIPSDDDRTCRNRAAQGHTGLCLVPGVRLGALLPGASAPAHLRRSGGGDALGLRAQLSSELIGRLGSLRKEQLCGALQRGHNRAQVLQPLQFPVENTHNLLQKHTVVV